MKAFTTVACGLIVGMLVACGDDDDTNSNTNTATAALKTEIVKNYATNVHANYEDALTDAKKLQTAIDAFLAAPTEETLATARTVWTSARQSYLQSEAFRFYSGPIDDADGPEGRINGWPLDENYIDYVTGKDDAGIINDPTGFPTITKEIIADANEKVDEKSLSAGWHAIEFLLWGQDKSTTGPGARPATDYVDGGTAKNQDRRRTYLKAVTDLLVDDIESVEVQWDPTPATTYGATFVSGPVETAITDMLQGIGYLSAVELPNERINNAYENQDQEEEHSCFSDTTLQDFAFDAKGIENVYFGRYGSTDGKGIDDLLKAVDPAIEAATTKAIQDAVAATAQIPGPFDQAILGADTDPGRVKIKATIDAWHHASEEIGKAAQALGLTINLTAE